MKKLPLILFVLVLTVICGCRRQPGPDDEQDISRDIYKGAKGLEMNFIKDMPQSRIYDTSDLTILLELENKGTYDLSGTNCRLYLSGFDDKIIRGLDKTKICSSFLEGKSPLNPEGGYSTQQFSTDLINLPDYLDSLNQRILLTACYEYKTKASPVVCIDPNLYEIGPIERGCTVRDVSVPGGQGAPVAVSGVNVEMVGKEKVSFNIKLSNTGGGTVLNSGADVFTDCPYQINPKDYNIVRYEVDMSGGTKIRCTPEIEGSEKTRLVNNKGTIYCTFDISGDSAYTTPLRITLDYNYMDSISKDVEIIKTPG